MNDFLTADAVVLFLFLYLLPGFLGQAVYSYLVEGEPQDRFDRVVTAFVLSLLSILSIHGALNVPFVPSIAITASTPVTAILGAMIGWNLVDTSVAASFIAAVFAVLKNYDVVYDLLNRLRLTYKTSNNDVWHDTFYRHRGFWIKVDFHDGRSLVGWPKYYSATGKPRELFMADASWWQAGADGAIIVLDVAGAGVYVSDMSAITCIEILN